MGKGWVDRIASAADRAFDEVKAFGKFIGADDRGTIGGSSLVLPKAAVQHDAALGARSEKDHDGWLDSLLTSASRVGAEKLAEALGPEGVTGTAIGGLPEGPRGVVGTGLKVASDVVETAGREAIRRPLATILLTLAAQQDEGIGEFVSADELKTLYNMTRTTSVGQAFAIDMGQVDPFDRAQVEEFRHSDFYRVASGITDATLRMVADVDVLAGKAVMATKASRRAVDATTVLADTADDLKVLSHLDDVIDPVKEVAQAGVLADRAFDQPGLDRIFASRQWAKVDEVMGSMEGTVDQRTAKIADRFFHEDPDGAVMAGFLARAKDAGEREEVMRILHGDLKGLQSLKEKNIDLGIEMADTMEEYLLVDNRAAIVRNFEKEITALDPEIRGYMQRFADEANEVIETARAATAEAANEVNLQIARNDILEKAAGTVTERPVVTLPGAIRTTIKSSEFYQTGPGRAIQIFTNMVPNRMLDVSGGAPQSVTHIRRYAQDAQFDADTIDDFVGRYANATTPLERLGIAEEMQDTALRRIAAENNIGLSQVEEIAQHATKSRRAARDLLGTRTYDAHGRPSFVFKADDGNTVLQRMPLGVTQTADMAVLDDITAIRKMFSSRSKLLREEFPNAGEAVSWGSDALESVMSVWRMGALLRPAWPARFTLDEHMRYGAKFGALAEALALKEGVPNLLEAQGLSLGLRDSSKLLARYTGRTIPRGDLASIALVGAGAVVGGPVGAAVGAALGAPLALMSHVTGPGVRGEFSVNGLKVLGAFGTPGDQEKLWRSQVSAGEDLDRLIRRNERGLLTRMHKDRSRFEVKMPNDADHLDSWAHVLNNVIGQDPLLARIATEGMDPASVAAWLKTADGYEYAKKLGFYSGYGRGPIDAWAERAVEMVEETIMAGTSVGPSIVARIKNPRAKFTPEYLARRVPDVPTRPASFGPLLEEHIVSQNTFTHGMRAMTDKAFEVLGKNTTDNLTRNPFFTHAYEDFMSRAINQVGPDLITPSYMHNLEERGRRYALAELNKYMYDLSERSHFAEMTRNLAVFFSAQQEIITRWAGIAVENPSFVARGIKVFNAPDKAGLTWTDPESGDEYIQFRIPEMFKPLVNSVPWLKGSLDSQESMRISKRGLLGLTVAFPSGPFVALALSHVAADNPELQASKAMQFLMPFGVEEGFLKAMTPTAIRRAAQVVGMDLDARERGTMQARILATRLVDMKTGVAPMIDMEDPAARAEFLESVEDETQKMLNLKFVTGMVMISPLSFDSPYKPYVDYYRALQDVQRSDEELFKDDPDAWEKIRNADEIFLEEMGPEFFDLTTSMTKSMNGIPATASGQEFTEKWQPFLNSLEDPALAGLVFGTDGGSSTDEYLSSFKRRQEKTPLRPGSDVHQREAISLEEAVVAGDVRVGWLEYVKGADAIDAARQQRGLPNLKVKAAADLALRKKALTENITRLYPAWREDFDQRDSGAWQRKVRDLWRIADNPDLAQRQSIAALGQYLTNREEVLKVMKAKGISDINSKAAVGIAKLWDSYVTTLTDDPAFSRTYHRWLENDPMNVESIRNG